jgi:hypothetical protein
MDNLEDNAQEIDVTVCYTTRTGVSEFKPRACRLPAETEKPFICISSLPIAWTYLFACLGTERETHNWRYVLTCAS